MRINDENSIFVSFYTLDPGDTFYFSGGFFMKTASYPDCEYNAVNLQTGCLVIFPLDQAVNWIENGEFVTNPL